MNALLVVDIQNDFLPNGALAVPQGDEVIPVANRLMPHFPFVVATQDWHPPGHLSFASSHPGHEIGETIELNGLQQILWPDHCVQGTSGAAFPEGLNTEEFDEIVRKGTSLELDSYSGFFDNDHRQATGLEDILRKRQVSHCFVLGLATDYCVKYTALDALQCGFATSVIQPGCRAVNLQPDDEEKTWQQLRQAGATLIDSIDSIDSLLDDATR